MAPLDPTRARPSTTRALYVGLAVLWLLSAVQMGCSLWLNDGQFSFLLDDPYIHLALAENLAQGHHGVNLGEASAPSSSILWPFLITPLSSFPLSILAVNLGIASISLFVFWKSMRWWPWELSSKTRAYFESWTMALFVIATNQVILAFSGMEHSLQLCWALLLALGLIQSAGRQRWPTWIWPCLCVAPLIRYELLALVAAISLVAVRRGQLRKILLCALVIALCLGAYSFFLIDTGLGFLPSSIQAKVGVPESLGMEARLNEQVIRNLIHPQGLAMVLTCIYLLRKLRTSSASLSERQRDLASALLVACPLHFVIGKYGGFCRYELYIWTFYLTVASALFCEGQGAKIEALIEKYGRTRFGLSYFFAVALLCVIYCRAIVLGPIASNNIYEQQFQMHRLVRDHYPGPVAVNDLGWVAYRNDHYVLDLWGLGSEKARKERFKDSRQTQWMTDFARRHKVRLVMVYDQWFPTLPSSWKPIASIELGRFRVTPAQAKVVFYLTELAERETFCRALRDWAEQLPASVTLHSQCSEPAPSS